MNEKLKNDAHNIVLYAIDACMPYELIKKAVEKQKFSGRLFLLSIGKAGWEMARAAKDLLKESIVRGMVITKYGHVKGDIKGIKCCEAGHPIPDGNSYRYTRLAIDMLSGLNEDDTVILLLSGGASALFELPLIDAAELEHINSQLLKSGADIGEINTIRKRLSAVKGGKLAKLLSPARIYCAALSDVLGFREDMIASGPVSTDSSTCADALRICKKYSLELSSEAKSHLNTETPKIIENVEFEIIGSVKLLCEAAYKKCKELGYLAHLLTDTLDSEASDAAQKFAHIAKAYADKSGKFAFIAGGETVVHVKGSGKGGRNQHLALTAAKEISGLENTALISVGSDGTDGPTDAAGGFVNGNTLKKLEASGLSIDHMLQNNDSYNALNAARGLVFTGPTGTNVNDITVLLIDNSNN